MGYGVVLHDTRDKDKHHAASHSSAEKSLLYSLVQEPLQQEEQSCNTNTNRGPDSDDLELREQ